MANLANTAEKLKAVKVRADGQMPDRSEVT
jgi:hypothetical protein